MSPTPRWMCHGRRSSSWRVHLHRLEGGDQHPRSSYLAGESAECRANSREPFECIITTGLFSNVYYDMQISETCVDPNAEGPTLAISNIARTRPVPAVAPVLVSVSATSARSLGVNFIAPSMGQCVFKAYKMEWMMQGWDYWLPYDDCTRTSLCSVGNFPASQSYYTVRMMVSCEDSLADSPWVEWPDFVQTWPEPAQAPTNFTLVELTAYNVTFTFEPGLGLDCTWASWKVQILQGISDPPGSQPGLAASPELPRAMAIAPSSAVTLAGADQAVRAAISAAQKSGWKVAVAVCDAGGNLIALQRMDGCMPIGAEIATEKARSAILFARETKLLEGAVNAEKSNGAGRAALLTSGRVLMEGGVPIVDPAHGRIIGACGVSGVKPDEDAQVAKAAVENLHLGLRALSSLLRTSEHWTDLTECENEMQFRENLTCTVTGLLSNTPYQVRVRETCTNYIYDSGWGYSPQFYSSMPVQAGLPQAFAVVENSVTAFFFDVTWVAGPAGQCVFKEWVMEVYQSSPEMGDWALPPLVQLLDDSQTWVEHKCLASRAAPLCRPGDLPRSLKQNSTYAVRVKESCTDPNADGDFVMLDFNVTTSIALEPAEAPDNLTISNETAYTFLLEFDAGCGNGVRSRSVPEARCDGVGNWSACDGTCGQRVRAVYCQSGLDEDCSDRQPTNVATCDLEVCSETLAEPASFEATLEVGEGTDADAVAASLQEAVSESLNVAPEDVSVELVNGGRRLAASQMLQFLVEVRQATKGLAEFLLSETSLQAVAVDVAQDLADSGIPVAVQMSASSACHNFDIFHNLDSIHTLNTRLYGSNNFSLSNNSCCWWQ
ncbi:unnamed protein product [Effrenium voratum]|nr:unnamed protein product [Effrenium voratum]